MLDYRTLFVTDLLSQVVFAIAMSVLSWRNRRIRGMAWFAAALWLGVVKTSLQGLKGEIPTVFSQMVSNQFNLLTFIAVFLGVRWFITRRERLPVASWHIAYGVAIVAYAALYVLQVPYVFVFNIAATLAVTTHAIVMLLRNRRAEFAMSGRVLAALLCGRMAIVFYRSVLILRFYGTPSSYLQSTKDPYWLYSMMSLMLLDAAIPLVYIWMFVMELQRELQHEARTDGLTGALNRRAMEEAAEREVARSRRGGSQLSILVLDLDRFKRLNDQMGHAAGDAALKAMVKHLRRELRIPDLIARSGGEEFIVLMPETDLESATAVAERLREVVKAMEVPFEGQIVKVTVSIGVSGHWPDEMDWSPMLRRADIALYRAKMGGRDCVKVITEELGEHESVPVRV